MRSLLRFVEGNYIEVKLCKRCRTGESEIKHEEILD